MTEESLRKSVMAKLKKRGGVWVCYPRTRFATTGTSDILGCYKGKFVAIELKSPDPGSRYTATALQLNFLDNVNNNLGYGIVAKSWEEVEALLDLIDRC